MYNSKANLDGGSQMQMTPTKLEEAWDNFIAMAKSSKDIPQNSSSRAMNSTVHGLPWPKEKNGQRGEEETRYMQESSILFLK